MTQDLSDCFFVYSYSHTARLDYRGVAFQPTPVMSTAFPHRYPLWLPRPPPGLSRGDMKHTKESQKKSQRRSPRSCTPLPTPPPSLDIGW